MLDRNRARLLFSDFALFLMALQLVRGYLYPIVIYGIHNVIQKFLENAHRCIERKKR
jgi:hypothetical protein